MVVRAFFPAKDTQEADSVTRRLCETLGRWGQCKVLLLEPDHRPTGWFKVYVELPETRGPDPVSFLRRMAAELATGEWDIGDRDPDEAHALWDERFGGKSSVTPVEWFSLELLPPSTHPNPSAAP